MKKLFFLICIILLLTSCNSDTYKEGTADTEVPIKVIGADSTNIRYFVETSTKFFVLNKKKEVELVINKRTNEGFSFIIGILLTFLFFLLITLIIND